MVFRYSSPSKRTQWPLLGCCDGASCTLKAAFRGTHVHGHMWLLQGAHRKFSGHSSLVWEYAGAHLFPIPSQYPPRTVHSTVSCSRRSPSWWPSCLGRVPSRVSGAWLHSKLISMSGSPHSLVTTESGWADCSMPTSSLPSSLPPFIPCSSRHKGHVSSSTE